MTPIEIIPADRWDPIDEFFSFFLDVLGSYLDLNMALLQFRISQDRMREDNKENLKLTDEELDLKPLIYGEGPPNNPTDVPLSITSQGAFRQRISNDGPDKMILDHMCIIIIFQAWEDHFRGTIADWIKVEKNSLKYDVMGDIRNLRQSIIHRGGKLDKSIDWLGLTRDEYIRLNIAQWKSIKGKLMTMCKEMKKLKNGLEEDPKWRFH